MLELYCCKLQHETFIRDFMFNLQSGMGIDFSLHRSKLRSLLFNFAVGYVIRKVQANHKELEWDGTHRLPLHINDCNLLVESIHCMKRNIGKLHHAHLYMQRGSNIPEKLCASCLIVHKALVLAF